VVARFVLGARTVGALVALAAGLADIVQYMKIREM
jgi:hypothetical protein